MNTSEKEKDKIPIFDLHCDLLAYLEKAERTPYDREVRCSIPQMKEGNVKMQALAIYTPTGKDSHKKALLQLQKYQTLTSELNARVAIENASGLLEENEDFELFYDRFEEFQKKAGPLLYLSLTWNDENRFGGGNFAPDIGLKPDGEKVLDHLDGQKIAIDLSHTSDKLAFDIFNYLDKKSLKIPVMASHSNFRSITDVPRNLPDDLAKEIMKRKGLIGLNLVWKFIGNSFEEKFIEMVEYGLSLGGIDHLCLGADFFYVDDFSKNDSSAFMKGYEDSSCYPKLLRLIKNKSVAEKIAYQNCSRYLTT